MKELEIRCVSCGARRTFRGRDADEVMTEIDASGWSEQRGGRRGWMPGRCEDCNRERAEEDERAE